MGLLHFNALKINVYYQFLNDLSYCASITSSMDETGRPPQNLCPLITGKGFYFPTEGRNHHPLDDGAESPTASHRGLVPSHPHPVQLQAGKRALHGASCLPLTPRIPGTSGPPEHPRVLHFLLSYASQWVAFHLLCLCVHSL